MARLKGEVIPTPGATLNAGGSVPPLPSYVQIEPVGQCNLKCTMCAVQFRRDGPPFGPLAFMPFERFTSLLDQFPSVSTLHLQGLGEPVMHPRFFDMVRYAVGKRITVTTNTNMTLLNERRAILCVESGLDCIHISMDGATMETYERIRLGAHFDRVVGNIDRLSRLRLERETQKPRMHLVVVAMKQNLHELPALVRFAGDRSMEEIFVQHLAHDFLESSLPERYASMRDYVDRESLLHEEPEHVGRIFEEMTQVAKDYGIHLRLPPLNKSEPALRPAASRCSWPTRGAYLAYDGRAMPCCMVSTPDRKNFGNMATDGVEQIWRSVEFQQFREALASDTPPEICRSCGIYNGTF